MKTQVKKGWGIVAVIGVVVALTMGDSLIMAAIGTAMLALGAWLGGYMDKGLRDCETRDCETGTQAGERRAA